VFDTFLSKVTVYDRAADNDELMQEIVKIRQKKALKLPDAIIAAKSHLCQTILVTADKQLISAVSNAYEFSVIKFN
jgi:predicted nucleic acid-binding protein